MSGVGLLFVWALSDNQGTVRDVVDGNGAILNHVVYDSFGRAVGQSDATVEFRYGYTGREQDNETGLDYYRARYFVDEINKTRARATITIPTGRERFRLVE
jgi:uncharacterized protein RhaS with RHS repeats